MKVTLVRHATLLLETSLGRVLVDPMLKPTSSSPPIEGTPNPVPNPLVELPWPPEQVVAGIDLCIVTHLHGDHFDDAADEVLPRDVPILTQPESAEPLRARGFTNVATEHPAIPMTRGHHGWGAIGELLDPVSGWVLDDVYLTGDTVLCDEVRHAIAEHHPRLAIVNAGGARFDDGGAIVMDAGDVALMRGLVERVAVVHLEAINHCIEPRSIYRALGVVVPDDGESLEL